MWAIAKLHPYLMVNKLDMYTDHYALQWLKSMRTGSAFLHGWSAALKEFDFTIHHQPGKDQGHMDGLSRLPIEPPLRPPRKQGGRLQVQALSPKETDQQVALDLHRVTHVGGIGGGGDTLC